MMIAELISQLEAANGPDRWADAKIDALFRVGSAKMRSNSEGYAWAWKNFPVWAHHKQAAGMCGLLQNDGELSMVWDSPAFTASLDEALGLSDRVLGKTPGNLRYIHDIRIKANGNTFVQIFTHPRDRGSDPRGEHRYPAIALCIAILKAKQALEVQA